MEPGMELDTDTLIEVLQNKLAMATVREAQMESAIQQLMKENRELASQVTKEPVDVEAVEG